MTSRRAIAVGFGGAAAVLAAGLVGAVLGNAVERVFGNGWPDHATTHGVFGVLVLAIALWVARVQRATLATGWAERGLAVVRLIALLVSATAVVESIGAYPPLDALHNIVYANVLALLALLLGFLFIAAVGFGRLVRRGGLRGAI